MGTAADLDALRTSLSAAIASSDVPTARTLALQAQAILGTSPSRQKHGDQETEFDASGAWLETLLAQLSALEASTATRAAGGVRRTKIRYANADTGDDYA